MSRTDDKDNWPYLEGSMYGFSHLLRQEEAWLGRRFERIN